jgi:hypothetical protein
MTLKTTYIESSAIVGFITAKAILQVMWKMVRVSVRKKRPKTKPVFMSSQPQPKNWDCSWCIAI